MPDPGGGGGAGPGPPPPHRSSDGVCAGRPKLVALGGYENIAVIGQGKSNKVFRAEHRETGDVYAIKAYCRDCLTEDECEKVWNQLHLVQQLDHPHVHVVNSALIEKHTIFVFEAYAERGDLFTILTEFPGQQLPEALAVRKVLRPLLLALDYLHGRGVIHRDVKPENILFPVFRDVAGGSVRGSLRGGEGGEEALTIPGRLVLSDFRLGVNQHRHAPMARIGTLDYMAPEVLALSPGTRDVTLQRGGGGGGGARAQGDSGEPAPYSEKVDIWAVGCLLAEVLSGASPFTADSAEETASLVLWATPKMPPAISSQSAAFIERCLNKDPAHRPSAAELIEDPLILNYAG